MPDTEDPPKAQALRFDWQDWLPHFDDEDIPDNDKRAMIEALWSIVVAFVDLGWDITPDAKETCGQDLDLTALLNAAVLQSERQPTAEEDA